MADPAHEKEIGPADPVAETQDRPRLDEPVDDEKEIVEENAAAEGRLSTDLDSIRVVPAAADSSALDRTKSSATDASATTAATSRHVAEPKPWYKQVNPLRWGKARPVPTEQTPCPEHRAGFFSQLFFQWMNPLMTVKPPRSALSNPLPTPHPPTTSFRKNVWLTWCIDGVQTPTRAE